LGVYVLGSVTGEDLKTKNLRRLTLERDRRSGVTRW